MGNIIYPFKIPIYQNFIDKDPFKIIKKDIYNFISNNPHLFRNIWECPTKTTQNQPTEKNIQSLTLNNQIKLHVENYFKIWNFGSSKNIKLGEVWVNIAKKREYQEEHNHGVALFSGVIYINFPKSSGNIGFINPLPTEVSLMNGNNIFPESFKITPKESQILLFPGWLRHKVYPNNSIKDRISVSFNIEQFEI